MKLAAPGHGTLFRRVLLCGGMGLVASFLIFSGLERVETPKQASIVMGVIGGQAATADGVLIASKQWAAVGSSVPFVTAVSVELGLPYELVADALRVQQGGDAPIVTVTAVAMDEATIRTIVGDVSSRLRLVSGSTDPRYPLTNLTGMAVQESQGRDRAQVLGYATVGGISVGMSLFWLIGAVMTLRRRG